MRLSESEKSAIFEATREIAFPVFLFGSRADDSARGGDIDILITTRGLSHDERLDLSLRVAADFQLRCDEKIDVIVFDENHLTKENEAFLKSIKRVRLK